MKTAMKTTSNPARVALCRLVLGATEKPGDCDSVTVTACVPRRWWDEVKRQIGPTRQRPNATRCNEVQRVR